MIIEMRTYTLKPGTVPAFEERFGAGLHIREKFSKLGGFWHTEVGALNQVIHVWQYPSIEERMRVRAAMATAVGWPPATAEFTLKQQSEVFNPAPFSPPLEPRQLGGLYEIRSYTYAPRAIPGVIERWSAKIGERIKLSPLVGCWHSEFGALNKWVHIWAYKDAAERARIRAEAVSRGIWPPGAGAPGELMIQENMLVVPAAFSPLR
jgi:hypothetical protein